MQKPSIEELDKELEALGLTPLSTLLENPNPLGSLGAHAGVCDMDTYEQWLNMRYTEVMRIKAQFHIDKREDDELYEWVLAHAAALGEALTNLKQAKERMRSKKHFWQWNPFEYVVEGFNEQQEVIHGVTPADVRIKANFEVKQIHGPVVKGFLSWLVHNIIN